MNVEGDNVAALRNDDSLGNDSFYDGVILDAFRITCGQNWRHVATWGHWLVWDGRHWRREETQLVKHLLTGLCSRIAKKHKRMTAGTRVAVVESLAQALREVARPTDIWDRDEWLFNAENATIDLRTKEWHRHNRDDNLTKLAGAGLDNSDCPQWKKFLDTITEGDLELQAYLQRVSGYCLTGSTRDQVLFFAYGTGANGKSTFVNTLSAVLGDYAKTVPGEVFMQTKNERHPTELAGMRGHRLVTAVEVPRNARWHETRIKMLTGGEKVAARFMHRDFFEFEPQFKLLIVGNSKPSLRSVDEAMRRRLHLLPFTVTIPADQRDENLPAKLLEERHGILQWALEGCADWQREGLNPPKRVTAATAEYFESQDTVARWLADRCDVHKDHQAPIANLFADLKAWAELNGEYAGSKRNLGEALESRGFWPRRGTGGAAMYVGLRLTGSGSSELSLIS